MKGEHPQSKSILIGTHPKTRKDLHLIIRSLSWYFQCNGALPVGAFDFCYVRQTYYILIRDASSAQRSSDFKPSHVFRELIPFYLPIYIYQATKNSSTELSIELHRPCVSGLRLSLPLSQLTSRSDLDTLYELLLVNACPLSWAFWREHEGN
jgi:hypothetical protein